MIFIFLWIDFRKELKSVPLLSSFFVVNPQKSLNRHFLLLSVAVRYGQLVITGENIKVGLFLDEQLLSARLEVKMQWDFDGNPLYKPQPKLKASHQKIFLPSWKDFFECGFLFWAVSLENCSTVLILRVQYPTRGPLIIEQRPHADLHFEQTWRTRMTAWGLTKI